MRGCEASLLDIAFYAVHVKSTDAGGGGDLTGQERRRREEVSTSSLRLQAHELARASAVFTLAHLDHT